MLVRLEVVEFDIPDEYLIPGAKCYFLMEQNFVVLPGRVPKRLAAQVVAIDIGNSAGEVRRVWQADGAVLPIPPLSTGPRVVQDSPTLIVVKKPSLLGRVGGWLRT